MKTKKYFLESNTYRYSWEQWNLQPQHEISIKTSDSRRNVLLFQWHVHTKKASCPGQKWLCRCWPVSTRTARPRPRFTRCLAAASQASTYTHPHARTTTGNTQHLATCVYLSTSPPRRLIPRRPTSPLTPCSSHGHSSAKCDNSAQIKTISLILTWR